MKKFFSLILALAMLLSLVACGGTTTNTPTDSGETIGETESDDGQPVTAETRVLKVATQNLTSSINYIIYEEFSRNLYEKTNGRYKL